MKPSLKICALGLCLGLFLVPSALSGAQNRAANEMSSAASKFLSSLNADQKAKAAYDLKDEERLNWHFIPKDRKGLPIKDMNPEQRKLAYLLLASALSEQAYSKATNIMSLELVLQDLEGANRRFPRDPELYYFWVFGKPDSKGAWGWRVEGHHISLNFTIVDGELISPTPSFFGANPAEVKEGPRKGVRVLAEEEDRARELVKSLNSEQRKAGIFSSTAPKEIITEAKKKVERLEKTGISADKLDKDQRKMLMRLIETYVKRYRPELAEEDLRKIRKTGEEKILFAWAGGVERGEGHYYRIQGPTFLMEYDNTQNNNNHIHSVWRDFENDFGEDLLRKHYREVPHQ